MQPILADFICKGTKNILRLQILFVIIPVLFSIVKTKSPSHYYNKVYVEVYDRYMLGICSDTIYLPSNPDAQRLSQG